MAVNSYFATLMGSWHGIHKGKIKSNFARNTCLRVREIQPLKLLNRGRELSDCTKHCTDANADEFVSAFSTDSTVHFRTQ